MCLTSVLSTLHSVSLQELIKHNNYLSLTSRPTLKKENKLQRNVNDTELNFEQFFFT